MGRRKRGYRFLPYDRWVVRPHKAEPPEGLWWWQILQPDERRRVLCVYFERRTYNTLRFSPRLSLADRWQRVCDDFKSRCAKQRGAPGEIEEIIGLVTNSTANPATDGSGLFMKVPQSNLA
jgi:hypothetical protein